MRCAMHILVQSFIVQKCMEIYTHLHGYHGQIDAIDNKIEWNIRAKQYAPRTIDSLELD